MPITINEFEIVPQSSSSSSSAAQPPSAAASASLPANVTRELERLARKRAERIHRLSTY